MDAGIMEPRRVTLQAVLFATVFGQAAAGQARTRMFVEPFANPAEPSKVRAAGHA